jgi:hypothetical protein
MKALYTSKMSFKLEAAKRKIERILGLRTDFTTVELQEFLHTSLNTATIYINHLLQTKQIYVVAWVQSGKLKQHPARVFRVGTGKAAPRPAPKPATVKNTQYRQRKEYQLELEGKIKIDGRKTRPIRKMRPDIAASWIKPVTTNKEQ